MISSCNDKNTSGVTDTLNTPVIFHAEPPQPTDDCPHRYGYFKVGDRNNCGQFMNCADGIGYVFDCPEGLAFNPESYRCDWPDQVPDCDAEGEWRFERLTNNSIAILIFYFYILRRIHA